MSDRPHILYRFYDADDELLYIGITNNPQNRFNSHRTDKSWFKKVIRSTMQHFPTREALAFAEIHAIQSERPKYNINHSISTPPTIQAKSRVGYSGHNDANVFRAPDAIASDCLSLEEREARLDEIEKTAARRPVFMPRVHCPSCDLICLVREFDGLVKCLHCLNMWTPDELTKPTDFEILKRATEGSR